MKFSEIASRVTGFSIPIFGVSWDPPEAERAVARRIIAQLEDRRVLYSPSEQEVPRYCADSVLEIRRMLTGEIAGLSEGSAVAGPLRAMRAACRKFLDHIESDRDLLTYGSHHGHTASWIFNAAVGELRGVFGVHLAQLATKYGLDIEDDLASTLPVAGDGDETA